MHHLNMLASEVTRISRGLGTDQVRDMTHCVIALANGDLAHRATVGCDGEMLELRETLNTMVEQLA